jgi:hypothetical protein
MANLNGYCTIRDFGEWALVGCEADHDEKVYLNKGSGETCDDPPEEVLRIISEENARKRLPVYESTPFRFASLPEDASHPVQVQEDSPACFGDALMILGNLLSSSECEAIITQAEAFGLEDCGYNKTMRVSDRVAAMAEELASLLFSRAKPFLPPIEVKRVQNGLFQTLQPPGVRPDVAEGTWLPVGLNPCFRVCRYAPGGFFQPHHDGGFDYSKQHRSIKTFMIYLNDDFSGGPTTFYNAAQKHYTTPDRSKALYDYQPESGSCLVFNHCLTHDGGVLKSGKKYILRTEVMYELVPEIESDQSSDSDF